jgi:hypothetical protein
MCNLIYYLYLLTKFHVSLVKLFSWFILVGSTFLKLFYCYKTNLTLVFYFFVDIVTYTIHCVDD